MSGEQDIRPDGALWRGCHERLGEEALRISVGGMSVDLVGLDDAGRRRLEERYSSFLVERSGAAPSVSCTFRRAPVERFLYLNPGEDHRVESESEGERFHLWSYEFAAWFQLEEGQGEYFACAAEGEAFLRGVENTLRFLYSHLALRGGGFLLHAAGLVRGGEAHLFLGPEGSGKSELTAASSRSCEVLSDDLVLVVRHDGAYRLCGVPFFGSFISGGSSGQIHPLHRVWMLQRGEVGSVQLLPSGLQRAYLMGAVSFMGGSRKAVTRALEACSLFLAEHPVRLLVHTGGGSAWEAADGPEEMER